MQVHGVKITLLQRYYSVKGLNELYELISIYTSHELCFSQLLKTQFSYD